MPRALDVQESGMKKTDLSLSAPACIARPVRLPLRTLSAIVLCAAQSGAFAQTVDFDSALRAAQQHAPQLQARSAGVLGAQALQAGAAQLPAPKLTLGIDSLPVTGPNRGSLTRDDFTQRQIGWMQDVPNQAKRAARADVALARTEREQALLEIERRAVRREAGLAWLASFFAGKRLALFDELITQQALLQKTAPAQLAAGRIAPADVTLLGIDALALEDRRDELRRDAAQASAQLQRWVGDTSAAQPSADTTSPLPVLVVDRPLLMANLARNPEIAALAPMRALASAGLREAEAAGRGDWSWSVNYGRRGPGYGDLVSVLLTFELPLSPSQRQQPQMRAGQQELERIGAEHADLVLRQTQEIDMLLAELAELDSKLTRLTEQAQPLAAQRSALTLAAYEGGRDKLAAVLEARKQQTELGLRALDLQAKQRAVQWRLNSIVAEPTP
jgi:outer membrane protein, heavy metal efflux system